MFKLGIDLETYSELPIEKVGAHKYIAHESFKILLVGFSIDGEEAEIIDLEKDEFPVWLKDMIFSPDVLKTAFNANFEIACLNKYFQTKLDPAQWECTMIKASMCGYPMKLEDVGKAMKLTTQKDRAGKALIKLFSVPNKQGRRVLPSEDPYKWEMFKDYCKTDVNTEQEILQRLEYMKVHPTERKLWVIDHHINSVGVMVDLNLAEQAVNINNENMLRLEREAIEITGLENPNSTKQLKEWLTQETGIPVTSLTKEMIKEILANWGVAPHVQRVLEIRQEMAKTSVQKYEAMLNGAGEDHRIRGLLQLYGAGKTGRWAGRMVQVQNLTHTNIEDIDFAREIVRSGDLDTLQISYGNVAYTLSSLIRTAFIAPPGKKLDASDFSAIEARITAWYANEEWRMEIFRGHGKIYEASAAQMFKVPIEEVDKALRTKGKIAELALGYQGGKNAMIKMGALKMGLKDEDLQPIVDLWRSANPNIVKFWWALEEAAVTAVDNPGKVYKLGLLKLLVRHNTLFIQLPSGRFLSYVKPHLKRGKFGKSVVGFWGIDQETKQWSHQETYGGKLTENVVQATARDVLADSIIRLYESGFNVIMHVHDEVVMESDLAHNSLEEIDKIMSQPISWAPDLPLAVKSFSSPYYIKD